MNKTLKKIYLVHLLVFIFLVCNAQVEILKWQKAVVNVECRTAILPKFISDSIIKARLALGISQYQIDSLTNFYSLPLKLNLGMALYIADGKERFLVTAKHVLFDTDFVKEKYFESSHNLNNWNNDYDAIFPLLSIRTPYEYAFKEKKVNNCTVV